MRRSACWILVLNLWFGFGVGVVHAHADRQALQRVLDSLARVVESQASVTQHLRAHRWFVHLIQTYTNEVPYAFPQHHLLHHLKRYLSLANRYELADSSAWALNRLIEFWNQYQAPALANRYAQAFGALQAQVQLPGLKVDYWIRSSQVDAQLGRFEIQKMKLERARQFIEAQDSDSLVYDYAMAALDYYSRIDKPQQLTVWLQQRLAVQAARADSGQAVIVARALADVYDRLNNIEGYLKYLKLTEQYARMPGKAFERAAAALRIGNLHRTAHEYPEALVQYELAQRLLDSLGQAYLRKGRLGYVNKFYDVAVVRVNLAAVAFLQGDYPVSARWAEASLQLAQRWGFFDLKMKALHLLAKAQSYLAPPVFTARNQLLSLAANDTLRQSNGHRFVWNMALGYSYLQAAQYVQAWRHYEAARTGFVEANTARRSFELHDEIETALYRCYAALKQPELAYRHLQAALAWRDSLDQNQQEATLQRQLVQRELEAKELEIETLTRKQHLNRARSQQTQVLIWLLVSVALLLAGIGVLLLARFRQRRRLQQQLLTLNALQIQRREELAAAYAEISATLQQVQDQNQLLELQQLRIEDSLTYAKRIQNAILPDPELLKTHLSDHLILFRPVDIVSGDYYWWERQGHHLLVGLIGCGRQGIPGAFVGAALLQLLDRVAHRAAEGSLAQLFERLENQFLRRNIGLEVFEPFALALIRIDLTTGQLEFTGAGLPLVVVHEQGVEILKPREALVGVPGLEAGRFKSRFVHLEHGNRIFLVTPGLLNQPDDAGTPLGTQRLAEVLERTVRADLLRQGDLLQLYLERWMGRAPQHGDWLAIALQW